MPRDCSVWGSRRQPRRTISRPCFVRNSAALVLHRALDKTPLDFFILFSSAAAVLGSPRLGAYAAANAFLDALASARAGSGSCAVSINWGTWTEAGMAAGLDATTLHSYSKGGFGGMTTGQGLDALARLLSWPRANCAVLPIDWAQSAAAYPASSSSPLLSSLLGQAASDARASRNSLDRILAAPRGERREAIGQYLRELLGSVTGLAASDIENQRSLTDFGLDSLMALETKNRVLADTGVSLPIVRFLEGSSVEQLGDEIAALLTDRGINELTYRELLIISDDLTEAEVDMALARLLENRA